MKQVSILTLVMTVAISAVALGEDSEPERITYEVFVEKAKADEVTKLAFVKVNEMSQLCFIEGTYKESDQEVSFVTGPPLDPAQDPLLMALLEDHKLKPELKGPTPVGVGEWLARNGIGLVLGFVPLILLVFVLIYVVRLNNKIDQVLIK